MFITNYPRKIKEVIHYIYCVHCANNGVDTDYC